MQVAIDVFVRKVANLFLTVRLSKLNNTAFTYDLLMEYQPDTEFKSLFHYCPKHSRVLGLQLCVYTGQC